MEEVKEEWKPIPNVNGYEVSSLGRVRSGRGIVKQFPNKKTKLMQVMTHENGKAKLYNVGRLVALAFHGEQPFETAVARHVSLDIQDNRPENIVWASRGGHSNIERHIARTQRYSYIIRQKTQSGLVIATYRGWDLLIKRGYRRVCVVAASNGKYMKDRNVYKGYCWEVIKVKNEYNGLQV